MSHADLLRFVGDMKKDPALLDKVKESAAGLDSIVALAKDNGYDFTVQEAKDYLQSQSRTDLSDEQMEALAGGKGSSTSLVTQVQSVQTVESATSAAVGAEVIAVIVLT